MNQLAPRIFPMKRQLATLIKSPYTCKAFEEGDNVLRIEMSHFNNTGRLDIKALRESDIIELIETGKQYKNLGYDRSKKAVHVAVKEWGNRTKEGRA